MYIGGVHLSVDFTARDVLPTADYHGSRLNDSLRLLNYRSHLAYVSFVRSCLAWTRLYTADDADDSISHELNTHLTSVTARRVLIA